MLSPQALLKGIIARALPSPSPDGAESERIIRLGRYGAQFTIVEAFKSHTLADEGSYFTANNGSTGVATAAAPTAYSDTAPLFNIYNKANPADPNAKRIYLDYLRLLCTAGGTAGVSMQLQAKLDNRNNYSSAGTLLTPVSPNGDLSPASIADIRFLPTNVAVSVNSRTVIGHVALCPSLSAVFPTNTSLGVSFGAVDGWCEAVSLSTTSILSMIGVPPIVIGPGQGLTIAFQITSQSAASSWAPEISWWEK